MWILCNNYGKKLVYLKPIFCPYSIHIDNEQNLMWTGLPQCDAYTAFKLLYFLLYQH